MTQDVSRATDIADRAAALHRDALVWDNHGCMPMEDTERWLDQLERHRTAGVDVAMINIGDSQHPPIRAASTSMGGYNRLGARILRRP